MANRPPNRLGMPPKLRLRGELLENRLLLTANELLWSTENPSTVGQASGEFGFDSANDSGWLIVGAPAADAGGLPDVGEVYVLDEATGQLAQTLSNPQPATGDRFGAAVDVSGSLVVVGAARNDASAIEADTGIAYVFDRTTGQLVHTLSSPAPAAFDFFGSAVAIDGDTIVVGSYLNDTSTENGGAVFVFDANSGTLMHTLTRTSAAAFDFFGASVAISGNRIVVGAERADNGASDDGEFVIFDANTGAHVATHTNPTPANFEYFGHSVAIDGDRVVVGAHRDDSEAVNAGHAYVYDLVSGQLQQTLINPFPSLSDNFGFDVDVQGDTVLVGAYRDDQGARDAGEAYLLDAVSGNLLHTLPNPDPSVLDYFGHSVSLSATRASVGAYWDDVAAQDAGVVVQFDATSGTEITSTASPAASSYDYFGQSVAATDARVAVGAPFDDFAATDAGSVYIIDAAGVLERQINHPAANRFDNFGSSLAIYNNVVAVGATRADVGSVANAGSVFLFDLSTGGLLRTITSPTPGTNDQFGTAIAIQGDKIAIGVPLEDTNGTDSGAAYVFDINSGALIRRLPNPTPAPFDQFGSSLSLADELLAVGARADDVIALDAGAAYVFDVDTGNTLATLTDPSGMSQDNFGSSVSILGNRVVVGAPGNNVGALNAGAAFLYESTTGALVTELVNPTPSQNAFFGGSVSLSSTYAVVGAASATLEGISGGAAMLFSTATGVHQNTLQSPSPTSGDLFGFQVAASDTHIAVGAPQVDGSTVDRGAVYVFDSQPSVAPFASAGGPYVGVEGDSISFDASASSDANQTTTSLTFDWDLDYDGITFDVDATGVSPIVEFDDDFDGEVAVRVTDDAELSSVATAALSISNAAPTLTPDANSITAIEGESVELLGSVSDPGADTIELSASRGDVVDLGDGRWEWQYVATDGPDDSESIFITAEDDDNATTLISFSLTVTNAAPTLIADRDYLPVLTGGIASVAGTVLDAGDDTVSLSASIGEITDNEDGTWTWSLSDVLPEDSQSVTLTATDSDGDSTQTFFLLAVGTLLPDQQFVLVGEGNTATATGILAVPPGETVQLSASHGNTLDNGDGTWSWDYATLDGPDNTTEVIVTADYSGGTQDSTAFDLVVENVSPKLTVLAPQVSVRAGRTATNAGTSFDIGDDTVSLEASIGLVVDEGDGTWSWSLSQTVMSDSQSVLISATDSDGATDAISFTLDVFFYVPFGQPQQELEPGELGESGHPPASQPIAGSSSSDAGGIALALAVPLGSVRPTPTQVWGRQKTIEIADAHRDRKELPSELLDKKKSEANALLTMFQVVDDRNEYGPRILRTNSVNSHRKPSIAEARIATVDAVFAELVLDIPAAAGRSLSNNPRGS